jgi:hypothetical protein
MNNDSKSWEEVNSDVKCRSLWYIKEWDLKCGQHLYVLGDHM